MPSFVEKQITTNNISSNNNARFFSKLAQKLIEMTTATNKRIEDAKNANTGTSSGAIVLASVIVPVMTLGVKYEYIEYINRYGPPQDGIFDEEKLEQLRIELGITSSTI